MRLATVIIFIVAVFVGFSSFDTENGIIEDYHSTKIVNSSGAPAGYTGAPGDNGNCTACHSGTVQSSAGVIDLTFSGGGEYVLGDTYNMQVTVTGGVRKGFQIVALRESDNVNVGTWLFPDYLNVQPINGVRSYATNTSQGNLNSSWEFQWQAPGTDQGYVNFYLATLLANNNSMTSGDVVYLDELRIASPNTVGVSEFSLENNWSVYQVDGKLLIEGQIDSKKDVNIDLYDLSGKKLQSKSIKNKKVKVLTTSIDVSDLKKGMYIISIQIGKNLTTKKVFI